MFEVPVAGDDMFDEEAEDEGEDQVAPFQHITRIWAPDAIVNQLTGPFTDFTCLGDVPRTKRVAPDARTWAGVELWLDWSPPDAAGYTDKTRTVCTSRQRTLFVTMLSAARAARSPPVQPTQYTIAICVAPQHPNHYTLPAKRNGSLRAE